MKTFNFNYTVTPKEGDDSWWIDIRKKNFECDAETLDEATQKFVEMMSDKLCVEISKSAAKRPKKRCTVTERICRHKLSATFILVTTM